MMLGMVNSTFKRTIKLQKIKIPRIKRSLQRWGRGRYNSSEETVENTTKYIPLIANKTVRTEEEDLP